MGKELALASPLVIGILNVTPDSFYDGGKFNGDPSKAADFGLKMLVEGADIIDLGGESSRPGSGRIMAAEEAKRVLPVLRAILSQQPSALVSIDTWKAEVARAALSEGACIINDISACTMDAEMAPLLARSTCGYILMHMQGTPETMQQRPSYGNVTGEIHAFFEGRISALEAAGVSLQRIVLDPGVGFGKKLEENLQLIASPEKLRARGRPLLYGISRKSFMGAVLGRPPEERLAGTTAFHMELLARGADMLRVHDVPAVVDAVKAHMALRELGNGS
jgi:dihydropteroate synthase